MPEGDDTTGPGTAEILLAALSVTLLTVGLSSTAWWIADQPAADWPAWIEAGATVAAVGAAIVAGLYAARAYGIEHRRDRRHDDEARVAQAQLVAGWWGEGPAPAGEPPEQLRRRAWGLVNKPPEGIFLRNASQVPVVEVDIVVRRPDTKAEIDKIFVGVLPPSATPVFQLASDSARSWYAAMPEGETPEVMLFFTDSAGRRWGRMPDGSLQPSTRIGKRTIYGATSVDEAIASATDSRES